MVNDFGKIPNFVFVLKIRYFSLLKSHPLVNPRKQTSWKVKMSMMSKRNLPFCSFRGCFLGCSLCNNFKDHQNNKSTNLVSKNDTVDGSEILHQFRDDIRPSGYWGIYHINWLITRINLPVTSTLMFGTWRHLMYPRQIPHENKQQLTFPLLLASKISKTF